MSHGRMDRGPSRTTYKATHPSQYPISLDIATTYSTLVHSKTTGRLKPTFVFDGHPPSSTGVRRLFRQQAVQYCQGCRLNGGRPQSMAPASCMTATSRLTRSSVVLHGVAPSSTMVCASFTVRSHQAPLAGILTIGRRAPFYGGARRLPAVMASMYSTLYGAQPCQSASLANAHEASQGHLPTAADPRDGSLCATYARQTGLVTSRNATGAARPLFLCPMLRAGAFLPTAYHTPSEVRTVTTWMVSRPCLCLGSLRVLCYKGSQS
jgi:hypothetical protein